MKRPCPTCNGIEFTDNKLKQDNPAGVNAPYTPPPSLDTFHSLRSKCLDAFASVEEAAISLLILFEMKSSTESFGQKLELLRKAKAGPRFSKARLEKLQTLLLTCERLNSLRNDIVHARLQLAVLDKEPRACFINTRENEADSQAARLFSHDGLRKFHSDIAKTANELKQLQINPASSPQPPSPGAAGDP